MNKNNRKYICTGPSSIIFIIQFGARCEHSLSHQLKLGVVRDI